MRSRLTTVAALLIAWSGAVRGQTPTPAVAAALAQGDSAWEAKRFDAARTAYAAALSADSLASPTAVFRLGTLRAWQNRLADAFVLYSRFRRMAPQDPDGPVAVGRTLAWLGRHDDALVVLDSAVRAQPDGRDAVLLRAQVLGWAGRYDAAIQAYSRWLSDHPKDREADIAVARTLAWAGRLGESEVRYRELARANDGVDVAKGLAQVTAWRGALDESAAMWQKITTDAPTDAEAWTGLAQVERWRGHPALAREALGKALAADPSYADAREQLKWVNAALDPAVEPVLSRVEDSDGNVVQGLQVGASGDAPWWPGTIQLIALAREATLAGAAVSKASSLSARGIATWTPSGGDWSIRAEAGLSQLADRTTGTTAASRSAVSGSLVVRARPVGPLSVAVAVASAPFDETAPLIASGIRTTSVDAEGAWTFPGRVTLSAGAGWASVSGTPKNTRWTTTATAAWTLVRGTTFALVTRNTAYDQPLTIGYFAPQRWSTTELQTHFELPRDLGWNVLADLALGEQSIRVTPNPSSSRFTQRAGIGLAWRPIPGYESVLQLTIANVASPYTSGAEYRAGGITWRGRVLFR
jgi:tetratricopeptide (TPR) repeat protein